MFTMTSEKFKKLHGDHLLYLAKEGKDWQERKANFSSFEIYKWSLIDYNMSFADFSNCKFSNCVFIRTNFDNCDFSGAKFYNCTFGYCSFKRTKFRYSNIQKCIFTDSDGGNNFENAVITKTVFEDARTNGSNFNRMKMIGCIGTLCVTNCSVIDSVFKDNSLKMDIGNIEYEKGYFSNDKKLIDKYLKKDKEHRKWMLFFIRLRKRLKI